MGNTSHRPDIRRCTPERYRDLLAAFLDAGQGHLFRFVPALSDPELIALFEQAKGIDLSLVDVLLGDASHQGAVLPAVEPYPAIQFNPSDRRRAKRIGEDLLRAGRVAFLTVAGGQATRLGVKVPKGCFPISPFAGKTLFAWHAEKVHSAERRFGARIPWLILLSATTDSDTLRYFEENQHFGLSDRIRFIRQEMHPTVDEEGRILLETPSRIAMAPNGHGGVLQALRKGATLDWLRSRGVDMISYFQVDNAPLNAADPVFLGLHADRGAEMSAKVIQKDDPTEPAGVLCNLDGRPGILEYSELPDELAEARDSRGGLLYGLINIAAHVFSLDFLERISDVQLPHHSALKQVTSVDDSGNTVSVRGRKFETFVFDAIPLARGFVALETDRLEEFIPLKNAEGDCSPETVRTGLLARSRRWFEQAGLPLPTEERSLEISPALAYDFETFKEWAAGSVPGGNP